MESITDFPKKIDLIVEIIEAKNLNVRNENTIVKVCVGQFTKKLRAKTKKTTNPYFNEVFTFSFFETQGEFLNRQLRIAVYKTKFRKLIGTCDIELTTVWEQYNHQYYHKWVVLTHPQDICAGVNGYLKCDIQIVPAGFDPVPHIEVIGTDIEDNLLVPLKGHCRRQNAIFTVSIFNAGCIVGKKRKCGKTIETQCCKSYIKVNFAGQSIKTKVANQSDEPYWHQALNFIAAIPSLFQTISIELWDKKEDILLGNTDLHLKDMGYPTELPSFGPSFVYLFSKHNGMTNFAGRLLISVECSALDPISTPKILKVTNISPLDLSLVPKFELFSLFIGFYQCLFFKKKYYKQCSFSIKQGSVTLRAAEADDIQAIIDQKNENIELRNGTKIDRYYSWSNGGLLPFSMQTIAFPVTYQKEYNNNFIKCALQEVRKNVVQQCVSEAKNAMATSISNLKQLNKLCSDLVRLPSMQTQTKLDKIKRDNFNRTLKDVRATLDAAARNDQTPEELDEIIKDQIDLILSQTNENFHTFPPIEMAVMKKMKLKIAQKLLKPEEVLYSSKKEESGCKSGQRQTIILRNADREAVIALDAFVWFGKHADMGHCFEKLDIAVESHDLNSTALSIVGECMFELRVHIFNGQLSPGSDSSGLADPFVRVIVFDQMRETQVKAQTLDPLWDESLLFSSIKLHGSRRFIKEQSISIVLEVLDYDGPNIWEVIGRCILRPHVTFKDETYFAPKLKREFIYSHGEATGEILTSMELIEKSFVEQELIRKTESQFKLFSIPNDIRPHFHSYQIETIFWGIRNYKVKMLPPFPKIFIIMKCNGVEFESSLSKAHQAFNFEYRLLKAELHLPVEKEYPSPLSFAMHEFDLMGRSKYKGGLLLPNISKFQVTPEVNIKIAEIKGIITSYNHELIIELDEKPDWWSKYYASKNQTRKTRIIKIYHNELEKQPEFGNFKDVLHSFQLVRGKTDLRTSHAKKMKEVAVLKCAIGYYSKSIMNTKNHFGFLSHTQPMPFTAHVYIVAAYNLAATDINGRCDPYIILSLGKTKVSDRHNYIYKDVNPIFGKCFTLKGVFPWDNILKIGVMDHDFCLTDDLIGFTTIDLESRFYSKHRANCGIADTFENSGYCKWRDLVDPSEILEQIFKINNVEPPEYINDSLKIGSQSIPLQGVNKEFASLLILNNLHKILKSEHYLVPEHIETRSLYHPENPSINRGKLEMWVDFFPGHSGVPTPVEITPRPVHNYQLRVVVWSVAEVTLSDTSWLTGEKSADIYVLGWLTNPAQFQKTDIHFKSLTGEGNFNWRFIFPFVYSSVDHKMIVYKRVNFSVQQWKEKIPCTLEIQVWDNDLLSDDFIGSLSLNLWDMPSGTNFAKRCDLKHLENAPRCSLFKSKKLRGWWPIRVKNEYEDKEILSGKIDLELELLSDAEAKMQPAGYGREGPRPLPEPKRPSSSFVWSMNPLAYLKILSFRGLGRKLLYAACVAAMIAFVLAGWLAIPGILLNKII